MIDRRLRELALIHTCGHRNLGRLRRRNTLSDLGCSFLDALCARRCLFDRRLLCLLLNAHGGLWSVLRLGWGYQRCRRTLSTGRPCKASKSIWHQCVGYVDALLLVRSQSESCRGYGWRYAALDTLDILSADFSLRRCNWWRTGRLDASLELRRSRLRCLSQFVGMSG